MKTSTNASWPARSASEIRNLESLPGANLKFEMWNLKLPLLAGGVHVPSKRFTRLIKSGSKMGLLGVDIRVFGVPKWKSSLA
jgi:hypothetical protein